MTEKVKVHKYSTGSGALLSTQYYDTPEAAQWDANENGRPGLEWVAEYQNRVWTLYDGLDV